MLVWPLADVCEIRKSRKLNPIHIVANQAASLKIIMLLSHWERSKKVQTVVVL